MAVAVFSDHDIGCDVEPLLAVDTDIAACFTPEEQATLRRSDDPNRDFTRLPMPCRKMPIPWVGFV